jgi:Flp pilus assembly protein TadG
MKPNNLSTALNQVSIIRRLRATQRGQAGVLMALSIVVIFGMTGLAIDVGRAYYAYQELAAATQAAAIAGAADLSTDTASGAIAAATNYSALSGDLNARPNLKNVTMAAGYPQVKCLTSTGVVCSASPANANAIVVSEKATVPMTFLSVIGVTSMSIATTATGGAKGGYASPYNVEIVVDKYRLRLAVR